ncbi:MAG: hypothetical protein K6F63_01720 [Lachnospiraceae bacterium]|nr:hypothetical protein [Lachnospiraceae bacterium]
MKNKRMIAFGALTLATVILFSGCGGSAAAGTSVGAYAGKWAYNHDTSKTALEIKAEGTAKLDGKKYTCTETENGVLLQNDKGDSVKVVFKDDENDILVYKPTHYKRESGTEGLVGSWTCDKWSFQFTEEGTFLEDGYFPGYYAVNEEESVIILIYNDMFDNTIIPYTLKDDELCLDYPWDMVRK